MTDQSTIRLVIGTLAVLALAVVGGGIYLTAIDRALPGELIAIGAAAAGGVAGILSRTTSDPQPVTGPMGGPVTVRDEGGAIDLMTILIVLAIIAIALWLFVNFSIVEK